MLMSGGQLSNLPLRSIAAQLFYTAMLMSGEQLSNLPLRSIAAEITRESILLRAHEEASRGGVGGVYVCVRESSFVLEQSILLRAPHARPHPSPCTSAPAQSRRAAGERPRLQLPCGPSAASRPGSPESRAGRAVLPSPFALRSTYSAARLRRDVAAGAGRGRGRARHEAGHARSRAAPARGGRRR